MASLNQAIFKYIYYKIPHAEFLNLLAIFFAKYLPYLMVLGFLVLVFYQKGWRRKLYLFCEATLAIIVSLGLIAETIKFFYSHPRPFAFYGFAPLIAESGSSFPSAHATFFFTLAMTVWYANRKWGVIYFILALLMGIARVYAGVHWPFDIIGGAIIGIGIDIAMHTLFNSERKQLA